MRVPRAMRRVVVFLILGGLALAGTATAYLMKGRRDVTTSSDEAYRLYQEGRQNELKLYHREALESYAAALERDPQFLMATLRLAVLMSGKDPQRAKSLVSAASSRCSDGVTAREQLYLRLIQAEFEKAQDLEKLLEEYIRRFPNDPEGYQIKADRLMRAGKVAEAVAELEKLLVSDPNHAFAYNTLGYYTASRAEWQKSEEYFLRYRYLAPDQANPHDSLGELYIFLGRYDEAERCLKEAIRIKPDFYASYGHMGTLEMSRGSYAAAADWYRRAADLTEPPGGRREFRVATGGALVFAGRLDEALAELERGFVEARASGLIKPPVRLDIDYARIRAIFLARGGRPQEGAASLDEAKRLVSENRSELPEKDLKGLDRNLASAEGIVLLAQGESAKAADLLGPLFTEGKGGMEGEYFPSRSISRLAWAEALKGAGREDEAREALRVILGRNPRFIPAAALALELGLTETRPL